MSIISKHQICINISSVKYLGNYSNKQYCLEIKIYEQYPTYRKLSLPLSATNYKEGLQSKSEPVLSDKSYTSSTFSFNPGSQMQIREIAIFQHEHLIFCGSNRQWYLSKIQLDIECKLFTCFQEDREVIGTYEGRIRCPNINQGLIIDFWETSTPCQFKGTIHTCLYHFYYKPNELGQRNFVEFCQVFPQGYVEQIFETLLQQIDKSSEALEQFMRRTKSGKVQPAQSPSRLSMQQYLTEKRQSLSNKAQDNIREEIKQNDEEKRGFSAYKPHRQLSQRTYSLSKVYRRESNRIFVDPQKRRDSRLINNVSIEEFQKVLNLSCGTFYEKWSKTVMKLLTGKKQEVKEENFVNKYIIQKLPRKISEKFHQTPNKIDMVELLKNQYNEKLRQIIQNYIVRLEGDWLVEPTVNQYNQKNKKAIELRKSVLQTYNHYRINFYSHSLGNEFNPVFFEEVISLSHRNSLVDKFQSIISQESDKKSSLNKIHLIILVHGLGANHLDMCMLKGEINRYFGHKAQQYKIMTSRANQNRTYEDISVLGTRFVHEVRQAVAQINQQKIDKISFVGHSLGGVIIRAALPSLEQYWPLFYSLVTFSSPHLGFNSPSSKLIDAGIWLMNNWRKTESITQLTLEDRQNKYETFLYSLSLEPGLQHFKKITFFSSKQDLLVPFYSARIQQYQKNSAGVKIRISQSKQKLKSKLKDKLRLRSPQPHLHHNNRRSSPNKNGGYYQQNRFDNPIHNSMCENIISRISSQHSKCQLFRRVQVSYEFQEQNLNKLIGRSAHLGYISNFEFQRLFLLAEQNYIF